MTQAISSSAVDANGLAVMQRYCTQLEYMLPRFPGPLSLVFSWDDTVALKQRTSNELKFEYANALFSLAAIEVPHLSLAVVVVCGVVIFIVCPVSPLACHRYAGLCRVAG